MWKRAKVQDEFKDQTMNVEAYKECKKKFQDQTMNVEACEDCRNYFKSRI